MSEMIKVLYIVDIHNRGGAVRSFSEMVQTLQEEFHVTPIVLVPREGFVTEICRERGYEYVITGHDQFYVNAGSTTIRKIIRKIFRPLIFGIYIYRNHRALQIAEQNIDFERIDIIHTNTERNDIGAILSKKYNIPHVWHLRVYGEPDYECFSLRNSLIRFMNDHTDRFVMISKSVADYWERKGIDKDKISVIYNGVDTTRFRTSEKIDIKDTIKIIMVGFISPNKGQFELLKAIAYLPNNIRQGVKVDFYGKGAKEYILKLMFFCKRKKIDNIVTFKGESNQIEKILPQYDIGIVCSKAEAFGRVTIEYMLCGLCVIASDTGANPELINDGKDGLLYRYGNPDDLSKKIEYLINNVNVVDVLKHNGRIKAESDFSRFRNAEKVYSLYQSLC